MPIFEIEKDGKTFEVDAPDMQRAAAALTSGSKSVSGFFDNVGKNVGKIAEGLSEAYDEKGLTGIAADVGKTFVGMGQQFIPGQQEWETQYADPLYKQIGKDLGFSRGPEGIGWSAGQLGENLYERPVDVALSASSIVAPVEATPGRIGMAAKMVNPINIAAKGVTTVAKAPGKVGKYISGELSGAGPQAISEAYRSGRVGGAEGAAFRSGMRDTLDPTEPVDIAKGAVLDLKKERQAAYNQDMKAAGLRDPMAGVTQPLKWQPIEDAFTAAGGIKQFRGKTVKPSVTAARGEVRKALDEWKADPGAWTPEGFDALKQRIQDIGESLNPMTEGAARTMVGNVASAIRREIVNQAPEYAKVMKAYERASNVIDEVVKTFSLGKKSTTDTALRKLQSVLRNNAFTNWTARAKLAELINKKAPELMPMLSGQAMNAVMPRGLVGKLLSGGVAGGAATMAATALNPATALPVAAGLVAASPRLVGEAVHGVGRLRGAVERAPRSAKAIGKTAGAVTARQQSLDHASNVIGPKVMEHIKHSPNTRGALNDWLKARYAGRGVEEATQMLAGAIVKELKVDDPAVYDRIIQELNQARGG